jgi:hypothetical protein
MAYYSPQSAAVTPAGLRKKLKPSYLDEIRGQYGSATEMVQAQKGLDLQDKIRQENMKLQKDALAQQKKQSQIAMGLQGAQLGLNIYDMYKKGGGTIPGINTLVSGVGKAAKKAGDVASGIYSSIHSSIFG